MVGDSFASAPDIFRLADSVLASFGLTDFTGNRAAALRRAFRASSGFRRESGILRSHSCDIFWNARDGPQ